MAGKYTIELDARSARIWSRQPGCTKFNIKVNSNSVQADAEALFPKGMTPWGGDGGPSSWLGGNDPEAQAQAVAKMAAEMAGERMAEQSPFGGEGVQCPQS